MPALPAPQPPGKRATPAARKQYNQQLTEQQGVLSDCWIRRMVVVRQPFHEKLTLLWHNHFATSAQKVRVAAQMAAQNQKLRTLSLGDFRTLAYAMLTDAAMLRWLDGQTSTAKAPNENLAREFMELFALGHGNGYTESDVRNGARALTGWVIGAGGATSVLPKRHDATAKTLFGRSANFDAAGFCDAVLAQPKSAGYVAGRLWQQLAGDDPPSPPALDRLVAAYGPGRDLRALTRAILTDPEFTGARASMVNTPIEWLIGVIRSLRVPVDDPKRLKMIDATLRTLGQRPFYPPSVGGWPSGQVWLSTAARLRAATELAHAGDLSGIENTPPTDRIDAVGYLIAGGPTAPAGRRGRQHPGVPDVMTEMNRRRFLIASAGVSAAGLLSSAVAVGWPDLMRAARDRPLAPGAGVLVIATLYGGNDGINTLIPYADNAYHDARPELAYAPQDVLHLDQQLGLNPALKGMAGLWNQRKLAVVRGAGYPKHDHSHFRSMDIWQTASPDEPVSTGWIGRWLDATGDDPLRAVNIGAVGAGKAGQFDAVTTALGDDDPDDTPAMAAVCKAYRAARTADATFASVKPPAKQNNSLAAQLDVVAQAVKARVPARVYTVQLGGFDTHAGERGTQQRLLQTFDEAVTGFVAQMAGRNVVLMAYSEFGRRVRANASQGTDHGTAGPVLIAGAPVNGGFYGEQPSLTDLDNGDLKYTTDFRDIYHELLARTVGTDPAPSVGAGRRDLGFLSA